MDHISASENFFLTISNLLTQLGVSFPVEHLKNLESGQFEESLLPFVNFLQKLSNEGSHPQADLLNHDRNVIQDYQPTEVYYAVYLMM
jgi:hypothetical protein